MFGTTSKTPRYDSFTTGGNAAPEMSQAETGGNAGFQTANDSTVQAMQGGGLSVKQPRLSRRELFAFTSQLAIMARTGLDMAGALQSLGRQARRPAVKSMLEQIHSDIIGGRSFSESLRRYEKVFGTTYVATIAAGEASGRMAEILGELARLVRSEVRLRNSIGSLLAYPILLTSVSSIVLACLVLVVLPQFADVFKQFDMPLPIITRFFLAISEELYHRMWLWGGIALIMPVALVLFRFSRIGTAIWDRLVLNTVPARDVTRSLLIGRTCRLLGITITSGVPLLESLRLVRSAMRNSIYRELFSSLEHEVTDGNGLAETLLKAPFIPSAAAEMIATAERTGTLAMVMNLVGEYYEEEGEAKLRTLVSVLEPVIIVVMGVVVAAIVLSVMLPMFDIATLSGHQ